MKGGQSAFFASFVFSHVSVISLVSGKKAGYLLDPSLVGIGPGSEREGLRLVYNTWQYLM